MSRNGTEDFRIKSAEFHIRHNTVIIGVSNMLTNTFARFHAVRVIFIIRGTKLLLLVFIYRLQKFNVISDVSTTS